MSRILIIEDDVKLRSMIEEGLRRNGFTPLATDDFARVKEEVVRSSPDLVIIDINLPQYDGFYWCRQIRTVSKVPVVFLSARTGDMDQVLAMENGGLAAAIQASLPDQTGIGVLNRFDEYGRLRQQGALTMFIGVFVCSVFFLAAGSLIYFKLFTEIGEDRRHYAVLRDIGITRRELGQLIGRELGALFFVPLAIGAVHTGFALKTLSNVLSRDFNVTAAGITVFAVYLLAQAVYYTATRASYAREVLRGRVG
ncbi:MAG TPA: response regulator [Bacillota bacterium]